MRGEWIRIITWLILPSLTVAAQTNPIPVGASISPHAGLVERIGGDRVEVSVLVKPGADPHTVELLEESAHRAELNTGESLLLKGFPLPVQSYVLASA